MVFESKSDAIETSIMTNYAVKGHSRPPLDPLWTHLSPSMSPQGPKITKYHPVSCLITCWHSQNDQTSTEGPKIA